jgi:phage FluMu protein Com
MTNYRCKHCGKVVKRDSDKQWIKSYCDTTGRNVRLQRIKTP